MKKSGVIRTLSTLLLALLLLACKQSDLSKAKQLFESENYADALALFQTITDNPESDEYMQKCNYYLGISAQQEREYESAIQYYTNASGFNDSESRIHDCTYLKAEEDSAVGNYQAAIENYNRVINYQDSWEKAFHNMILIMKADANADMTSELSFLYENLSETKLSFIQNELSENANLNTIYIYKNVLQPLPYKYFCSLAIKLDYPTVCTLLNYMDDGQNKDFVYDCIRLGIVFQIVQLRTDWVDCLQSISDVHDYVFDKIEYTVSSGKTATVEKDNEYTARVREYAESFEKNLQSFQSVFPREEIADFPDLAEAYDAYVAALDYMLDFIKDDRYWDLLCSAISNYLDTFTISEDTLLYLNTMLGCDDYMRAINECSLMKANTENDTENNNLSKEDRVIQGQWNIIWGVDLTKEKDSSYLLFLSEDTSEITDSYVIIRNDQTGNLVLIGNGLSFELTLTDIHYLNTTENGSYNYSATGIGADNSSYTIGFVFDPNSTETKTLNIILADYQIVLYAYKY